MNDAASAETSLDVVDLAESPAATASEFDRVCREIGFLKVVGHGVSPDLRDEYVGVTTAFFDLPIEQKNRSITDPGVINRGYMPLLGEQLGTTLNADEDRARPAVDAPDLYESFTIGLPDVPDDDVHRSARGVWIHENVWPEAPAGFEAVWRAWWKEMRRLSSVILDHCAAALGLADGWLDPYFDRQISALRAINYPEIPTTSTPGQMRVGPHTDYGNMTVLLSDEVPGLEVHRDGDWVAVAPDTDAFVVNVGDLMSVWTNGRWRSTLHRVVPVEADGMLLRRRSFPYFQQPNHDALISCLATCTDEENPPRYAPVTSGEHYDDKIRRQFVAPATSERPAAPGGEE